MGDSGAAEAAQQARAEAEAARKQNLAEQAKRLTKEESEENLRRRLQFGGGLGGTSRREPTLG